LNQTLPAKEIIVVDDGSTDGTAEKTLEAFQNWKLETGNLKKDGREQFSGNSKSNIQNPTFKILSQANAGPGAARNRGLAEATGEFIHFFDSDDIAAPNKHEVQLRALLDTGADIAYGPWVKGRFASKEAQMVAGDEFHAEARRRGDFKLTTEDTENTEEEAALSLGKPSGAAFTNPFTSELARDSENTSITPCASAPAYRFSGFKFQISGFSAIGPVIQARGLPEGYLVWALLTNWSIVPHACLFRRSILEKAGGFPEDIWVGEDQLLFLRCLLAGAKVVHTPETMVFYRVGDDPGKLTATGAAQKRHARDWGRFLLSAKKEIEDRRLKIGGVPAEAQRRGNFLTTIEHWGKCEKEQPKVGPKCEGVGTNESKSTEGAQGDAQGTCAGDSEPDSLTSKLADSPVSESLTRSASGPASLPATSYSLLATAPEVLTTPSAWFGFRLRAYEAWRDLEKFFPHGEDELKNQLQGIWKGNWFSGFVFQVLGFILRKLGGLKLRVLGYREHASFRCGKFSSFIDFGGQ
jgi:GT2 family glycosyltransferase